MATTRDRWMVENFRPSGVASALQQRAVASRTGPAGAEGHQRPVAADLRRRKVDDLFTVGDRDGEFPRHVWQLRQLGYSGNLTLTSL